jgi:oligopeptidase A
MVDNEAKTPPAGHNPLLELGFNIPFEAIAPGHVEKAVQALCSEALANIEAIESNSEPAIYANTLGALDTASEKLEVVMTVVGHIESVVTSPELREVYNRVRPDVSAFYASIPLRPKLWQRLKAYAGTPDAAALTGARRRFLEKTLEQFRREGADLGEPDKRRLEAISRELAELTSKFS